MVSFVVDTNVLVVANGKHENALFNHVYDCQKFLNDVREKKVSIDSLGLILKEYFRHASRSGQPGMGDAFAKWLWNNKFTADICERVDITPDKNDEKGFVEFPSSDELKGFDPSDRKFVAVALKSRYDARIYNATDSDWLHYRDQFEKLGLTIVFLCPDLIKGINSFNPSV